MAERGGRIWLLAYDCGLMSWKPFINKQCEIFLLIKEEGRNLYLQSKEKEFNNTQIIVIPQIITDYYCLWGRKSFHKRYATNSDNNNIRAINAVKPST